MFTRVLSNHKASPAPVCWQQPLQALCSQPCPVSRGCPVWRGLKLEGWGSVRNLGSRREGGCCPGVDVSVAQQSHTSESLSPPQADMWSTCLKQGKKKKNQGEMVISVSPLLLVEGAARIEAPRTLGSLPKGQLSRLLVEAGLNTRMAYGQKGSDNSRTPVLADGSRKCLERYGVPFLRLP